MSDLFHDGVSDEFVARVFNVMRRAPQHRFQVLTKRAQRMARVATELEPAPNVWMGVSVEHADYVDRIDVLGRVPAAVRFLSLEPLLGPLDDLDLAGIHWVSVGGESGPGARPMAGGWVRSIGDRCLAQQVPFFFKPTDVPGSDQLRPPPPDLDPAPFVP